MSTGNKKNTYGIYGVEIDPEFPDVLKGTRKFVSYLEHHVASDDFGNPINNPVVCGQELFLTEKFEIDTRYPKFSRITSSSATVGRAGMWNNSTKEYEFEQISYS